MKPTIAVLDAATGQMTHREMTDAEHAEYEQRVAASEAEQATKSEAAKTAIAAKKSARSKLKALGLTDDEIAALVG